MSFKNFSTTQDAHPKDMPDVKAKEALEAEKQAQKSEATPAKAAPADKSKDPQRRRFAPPPVLYDRTAKRPPARGTQ